MPKSNPPPMTSKQAKRVYQKSGKKFEFTPSQLRALDRRAELEERAKRAESREKQKKVNKRKREEKEEREREAKRQRAAEGKIREEDTWGKVPRSQPRLNSFFQKVAPLPETDDQTEEESAADNESNFDSGADHLGNHPGPEFEQQEEYSEELADFFSQLSQPVSEDMPPKMTRMQELPGNMISGSLKLVVPALDNTKPSAQHMSDYKFSNQNSNLDFTIAEDNTAERPRMSIPSALEVNPGPGEDISQVSPSNLALFPTSTSPLKRKADRMDDIPVPSSARSVRSVLSEMSPSKVNIRAQEKPDVTTIPKVRLSPPSPPYETRSTIEPHADLLAMISTQDFLDDEFPIGKENLDPGVPQSNGIKTAKLGPQSEKNAPVIKLPIAKSPLSGEFDDLTDFGDCDDFETELDEFGDDGITDDLFAGLSTQIPAKNTSVSITGSPRKAKVQEVKLKSSAVLPKLRQGSVTTMVSGPSLKKSKSIPTQTASVSGPFAKTNSFSFEGVEDKDLVDLMAQLEDEGRSQNQRTVTGSKKPRILPWNHPSQFPHSLALTPLSDPAEDENQ